MKVPSPEATGGAGGTYEARVGAIALARLLRGDSVEGLDLPIARVSLQQRYAGHMLDDVVIEGTDALGSTRIIEYQAKRRVSPAPSDSDFVETIKRCLEAIRGEGVDGEIAHRRKRFGLVANPSAPLKDLSRVTQTARAHDRSSSFLKVVRTTANAGVVQRLNQLRTTVFNLLKEPEDNLAPDPSDADVDTFTWKVARSLYVWQVDAEPEGTAILAAQDRISDLLLGASDASAVYSALINLARDWAAHAASIDLQMLRGALEEHGFALNQAPRQAAAFAELAAASARALDADAVRLGRQLLLPREDVRAGIVDVIARHDATLLSGQAGVGKSMLARLVAANLQSDGATVVGINLSGRSGGLNSLEAELGVSLREGFAGCPIGAQRLLVIDGAEQALSDAGQLLKAVLAALPADMAAAPPWRVLLTARDEAAATVLSIMRERVADTERFTVGELTDDEVGQAVAFFPALEPLRRNPRAEALLLRRPYLLELLIRSTAVEALPADLVGEEDLVDVVTTRLVRRDNGGLAGQGAPDARSDIYLAMAAAAITDTLPARLDGRDADARQGLFSDGVIAPSRPTHLSWRFAHDVLVDYAVATTLLEPDGRDLLATAVQPRRLLRAVRLWMQRELTDACANGTVKTVWQRITADSEVLASRDGDRWKDVPYEALLHMGSARDALEQLTDVLVDQDGSALFHLLDVAERLGRLNVAYPSQGPIPLDSALTGSVVDLLAALGPLVPARCVARAARLVHHHLAAAFTYVFDPEAGLGQANKLPSVLIGWIGEQDYGDTLSYGLGSLSFLGAHLNADNEAFLVQHARRRPHQLGEVVEANANVRALVQSRPDLMLHLAGLYYIGRGLRLDDAAGEGMGRAEAPFAADSEPLVEESDCDEDLDEEGVRHHDARQSRHLDMFPLGNDQANPTLGPFLPLLNVHATEGLCLIGAVVDAATVARARLEAGFSSNHDDTREVQLTLRVGEADTVRILSGPSTVWCWHRRTAVGPGPAQSALMALRQWASSQVEGGVNLGAVVDQILSAGSSLAFASVAWFVMLEHLDLVTDEMDQFLVQREVWDLETVRTVHESSGLALAVPEVTRSAWDVSHVAMQLVLRGDMDRRKRLAGLAAELVKRAKTGGYADLAVVQRRASELDIANYRTKTEDEITLVSVEYDPAVVASLAETGEAARRGLHGAALLNQARAMRDGEEPADTSEELWLQIKEHLREVDNTGLYDPQDIRAAAAACVVRGAYEGGVVDSSTLIEAVAVLMAMASDVGRLAPPELGAIESTVDTDNENDQAALSNGERVIRDMAWDVGFDRSVATALPLILVNSSLAESSSVNSERIKEAVVEAAGGPYNEARARLSTGLFKAWAIECQDTAVPHLAAVQAAVRIIETSGYGPLAQGRGYSQVTLPKPVGEFLDSSMELVLDLDAASFAIPLLAEGSKQGCIHGIEARELLDSLIHYDERVWPHHYARRHYVGTTRWRTELDRVVARRILSGDDDILERRLDAFSGVHEEIASLLRILPEEATDVTAAIRLHNIWSRVLDRLLPRSRNLGGLHDRKERPNHRDVDELDRALLLVPGEKTRDWPWRNTVTLGVRWGAEYKGRPGLADRAITFSGRLFGLRSDIAWHFSLSILGTNYEAIKRDSSLAVPFLQITLRDPSSKVVADQARGVLDGLAAIGDEHALEVQRSLENS